MPSGDINFCEIPRRLNSNTAQQNITARHNNYYYCIHLMDFFQGNQKAKPVWILLEQEMMGWQWHKLGHM